MAMIGRVDKTPLGIYIHIPFCRSKCRYCDFYSLPEKNEKLMKLVETDEILRLMYNEWLSKDDSNYREIVGKRK